MTWFEGQNELARWTSLMSGDGRTRLSPKTSATPEPARIIVGSC